MTKIFTLSLLIIGIISSCQKKSDMELIESLTEENTIMEHNRIEMQTYKKDLIENIDVQYVLLKNLIDPKKKNSFENDVKINLEFKNIKEEIEKISQRFEDNFTFLEKSNKSNYLFIELTKGSSKSEKEIKDEWRQNVSVSEGIIEKNKVLQLKLHDLSERNKKLIDKVIEKYGVPTK